MFWKNSEKNSLKGHQTTDARYSQRTARGGTMKKTYVTPLTICPPSMLWIANSRFLFKRKTKSFDQIRGFVNIKHVKRLYGVRLPYSLKNSSKKNPLVEWINLDPFYFGYSESAFIHGIHTWHSYTVQKRIEIWNFLTCEKD